MTPSLHPILARLLPSAHAFLCDMIRLPSTPGSEHDVMLLVEDRFKSIPGLVVERVPMSDDLKQDPDYSDPVPDIKYQGRFNLRILRKGSKTSGETSGGTSGGTLLFNAHTDVVPASEGQIDPFNPRTENNIVFGRGACDDKGQVATLYLLFQALAALDVRTAGHVIAHLVVEEENGGNGSLAMTRRGESADACIVMEGSEGKLFTSIRGAVWFKIVFHGTAGHSGQAAVTKSALLMARDAMAILEKFHADLLASSRGIPLFDPFPNPMPITFGKLAAGNWPAAAPARAQLEGVLGLLPNKSKEQVMHAMRAALSADPTLAGRFDLTFMYRHDSSVVDPSHPFPQAVLAAAKSAAVPLAVSAMTASCDAWFYNNQLKIPTVVYGPGTLKVAHSKDEQISLSDIADSAALLLALVKNFCGAQP